jgi:methylase of polypeptide subunit release factors
MSHTRYFDGSDTVRRARQCLDDGGFTLGALTERLGTHAFAHLAMGELVPLLRATRAGDRLDTLLRLFVVGVPVSLADARAALAPLSVEQWVAGGVVATDDREVRSRVAIRPLGGPANWFVVHDFTRPAEASIPTDHVLGLSASTMALAGATIRREISSAFDLGTGCGIQALHASAHSSRVVASDINPRATACATLTMEINEIANASVRQGDLLAPVEGERFDLVVANPPFVISPSHRYLYRDSELAVDELCRQLVRAVPRHLADGGHCQLLASWAHVAGEDWRDRLEAWFEDTGCDALVFEREMLEPSAHAASWLRQTEPPGQWQPEYDEWMAYYERHCIEAVGFGLITMRKRAEGDGWFRAEEAPHDWSMPCGDHLGAVFELADLVDGDRGERLVDVALRIAPDVVLDERARPLSRSPGSPGSHGWLVTDRMLRQTAGLRREGHVDESVAAIAAACDGTRPLGAVLAEIARAAQADQSDLARAALPVVHQLVERGFLLPEVE